MERRAEEFIAAAQDLHASGEAGFYMLEIGEQMARNDETYMRRHNIARKVLGLVGVNVGEPNKMLGRLYPIAIRLQREGALDAFWEESESEGPRRRIYRLVKEPSISTV